MSLPPLRDYQADLFTRTRAEVARLRAERPGQGVGVLVQLPTGGGKTRVALEFAARARARGRRTLFTAPRTELVSQPYEKIRGYGWEDVRVLRSAAQGGDEGPADASVIVSTVQTLLARGELPDGVDVVVLDEARHYAAESWGRVPAALAGVVRIALDATPARSDGKSLRDVADRIVCGPSVAWLTEHGHLVPSRVFAPPPLPGGRKDLASRPVDAWLRYSPGMRAIVYAGTVEAARAHAADFAAAGVACEVVSGSSRPAERRGALERLASGATRVICNCSLYVEGLDVVEVEAIILARRVGHVSQWVQMGGRALRPSPHTGKTEARILDLLGSYHTHGDLDTDRAWTLDGGSGKPRAPLPPAVQCRACHAWGPGGGLCPCGATRPVAPPPRVRAADLVDQRAARDGDGVRRQRLLAWVDREVRAGRSPWRAAHVYRGTYGSAPPRAWMEDAVRRVA